DELLPHFRPRFDLVERGQIAAVLGELKLEAGALAANEAGRLEFGRLAKVRYLVVGSASRLGGLTVNARLVDVQAGLIVQTGKGVGAGRDELPAKLAQLARMLQMSDEQKVAYEGELVRVAVPPPATVAAPAPVVFVAPPPPDLTAVVPSEFERIPASGA